MTTGFLHPGAMGAAIAEQCRSTSLWASEGRSEDTRRRASSAGLTDAGSLTELVRRCDVVVSICPPAAALDVARAVSDAGFGGLYVDANAIAPHTARAVGELFERFVDGGIIGPPPRAAGSSRLYLAGDEAAAVAELWQGTTLEARVLDGVPGTASALKMAFAAWTKGSSALLLAVNAFASAEGVADALDAEWAITVPDAIGRSEQAAASTAPKAWRFVGEMEEIAASFADAHLPDGFHRAAAEVYARIAGAGDRSPATRHEVSAAINDPAC